MRLLMTIHGLPCGGAEIFFVRLARALAQRHELTLYIPCLRGGDAGLVRKLAGLDVVSVPGFSAFGYRVFYKLKQMIWKRLPELDIEERVHRGMLHGLHARRRYDVINPHLMEAARFCCQAFARTEVPIIESDHGHWAVVDALNPGQAVRVINRLDGLICPAQANVERAARFPWKPGFQVFHIPYGYEIPESAGQVKAGGKVFTFGMVARGVHYKGWHEALVAVRRVRQESARAIRLVLVGAGPAVDELRNGLPVEDRAWVTFAGHRPEPESFVRSFDAGLLPTWLPGESLPNSIIEYLAQGKPVIATDVGGIPEMLRTPGGDAGILVPRTAEGPADVEALTRAMRAMVEDPGLYQELAGRTAEAFARYRMETCVASYEAAFTQCAKAGTGRQQA